VKEKLKRLLGLLGGAVFMAAARAQGASDKANILVIWGDDVGYWNISAYNQRMMGYQTPNIDSIANQGALFAVWYA
jgi:arylsulfatase